MQRPLHPPRPVAANSSPQPAPGYYDANGGGRVAASFVLGSPSPRAPYDRAALAAAPMAERGHCATGASSSASGYPTAPSVWAPPPLFASLPSFPDAPQHPAPYKSPQPPAVSAQPAPQPYAAYLYSISPAFASTSMAISSRDNAQLVHVRTAPPHTSPEPADDARAPSLAAESEADADDDDDRPARRHACPMCHRAFDRPVTLKKHLVVHTGEKAFQCPGCSKRFSIESNRKRHMRKCCPDTLPFPAPALPSPSPPAASSSSSTSPPAHPRKRAPSPPPPPARPKRRRRAPSPSHWVPDSLRVFDLTPYAKSTPVPLPPVAPSRDEDQEERNSFEDVGGRPYHPEGWTGRLPGPALVEPEGQGPMGVRMFVISA